MPFLLCKRISARRRDPRASPPGIGTKGSLVWDGCARADKSTTENWLSFAYKKHLNERSESRAASICINQRERGKEILCECHNNQVPSASHALIPLYGPVLHKLEIEIPYIHQLQKYLEKPNWRPLDP